MKVNLRFGLALVLELAFLILLAVQLACWAAPPWRDEASAPYPPPP